MKPSNVAWKLFAKSAKEAWMLAGILLVATCTRFWRFWDLPLTYDEYSSWYRMGPQFEGCNVRPCALADFTTAVASDAHPMLHHAWYRLLWEIDLLEPSWTSNLILKAPFLLAGVLTVWLCYVAGKRWMSAQSGLLVAGLMAVLQPAVMHAQIARPYALGLLFVMALAVSLKGVLKGKWTSFVWSAVWLALAMYSHYFAGLTAIGLGAVVLIAHRDKWKPLLGVSGLAALFFAPHIGITLQQLGHGDLATVVSVPDFAFLTQHLEYSFNYALPWFFIVGLLALVFWKGGHAKKRLALLAIWGIPFGVGLIYSLVIGPILQDRVLVFGLPFLIAALVGFWKPIPGKWQTALLGVCVFGLGAVLVFGREHYKVFYEREYSGVWEGALQEKGCEFSYQNSPDVSEGAKVNALLSYHESILGASYYRFIAGDERCELPLRAFMPDSSTTTFEGLTFLNANQSRSAFIGLTGHYDRPQPEFLSMFLERYPSLHSSKGFHNGAWYWLTDEPSPPILSLDAGWSFASGQEWGETIQVESDLDEAGWLFLQTEVSQESGLGDMRLVCEFKENGERVHYKALKADMFRLPFETQWTVHLGFFLEDMRDYPDAEVEVYWWNPSGARFTAGPLQVRTLPRNPYQYGLTQSLRR